MADWCFETIHINSAGGAARRLYRVYFNADTGKLELDMTNEWREEA